jgi:hypothetical protein
MADAGIQMPDDLRALITPRYHECQPPNAFRDLLLRYDITMNKKSSRTWEIRDDK